MEMTIKTLEFIHELLKKEENIAKGVYNAARKLQHEYEESETQIKSLIKSQKEAADQFMAEHLRALEALTDFEQQEW